MDVLLFDLLSKIHIHYTQTAPKDAYPCDISNFASRDLNEAGGFLRNVDEELAMLLIVELEKLVCEESCHLQDITVLLQLASKIGTEEVRQLIVMQRRGAVVVAIQQLLGKIGRNYNLVRECT